LAVKIYGNRGAQQEISVSRKVSKETISTGIPNLRVWFDKWSAGHPESESDKKSDLDFQCC